MRKSTKDNFYRIAIGMAILIALGVVGTMDYDDAVLEVDMYCQNVHAGHWPDYNGIYQKECKDGRSIHH